MSRLNCGVPIYALTAQTATRYRCALYRDVYPLMVKYVGHDREELLAEAEKVLVENGVVKDGDLIVLTIGEPIGKSGGTNTMKIVRVGEHRKKWIALLRPRKGLVLLPARGSFPSAICRFSIQKPHPGGCISPARDPGIFPRARWRARSRPALSTSGALDVHHAQSEADLAPQPLEHRQFLGRPVRDFHDDVVHLQRVQIIHQLVPAAFWMLCPP
jgi:hypothetical protein